MPALQMHFLGESNCSHLITWQPLGKHVFGARCLFEVKKTSLLIWALFVEVNIVRAAHFVQLEHCILFFDSLHFPRVIFAPLIPHDGLSCHGCGLAHPNPPIVPHQIAPSSPPPPLRKQQVAGDGSCCFPTSVLQSQSASSSLHDGAVKITGLKLVFTLCVFFVFFLLAS